MEASVEKGKNGHLNPAFHLKVVGPINKASGHKGVSGMCVCWKKKKRDQGNGRGLNGCFCCCVFVNNGTSMRLTFILNGLILQQLVILCDHLQSASSHACKNSSPIVYSAFSIISSCRYFLVFMAFFLIGWVGSSGSGYICHWQGKRYKLSGKGDTNKKEKDRHIRQMARIGIQHWLIHEKKLLWRIKDKLLHIHKICV